MSVIDEYLASLTGPEKATVAHIYGVVRKLVPEAVAARSYGMPALKYKGKGLVAVMANKRFLSLYPFQAVDKLNLDLGAFECTSGSIHFSVEHAIPDELLQSIIRTRMEEIDRGGRIRVFTV